VYNVGSKKNRRRSAKTLRGEHMPLPRKKDDGAGGAPVLDIMSAHVEGEGVPDPVEY
jgi:hypothetical protein